MVCLKEYLAISKSYINVCYYFYYLLPKSGFVFSEHEDNQRRLSGLSLTKFIIKPQCFPWMLKMYLGSNEENNEKRYSCLPARQSHLGVISVMQRLFEDSQRQVSLLDWHHIQSDPKGDTMIQTLAGLKIKFCLLITLSYTSL